MLAFSYAMVAEEAVNRTALPPGNTCGQRCVNSPCSSLVSCSRHSSRRWNERETGRSAQRCDDIAVFSPTRTAASRCLAHNYGCAPLNGNLLHLSVREEADPLTIGREERIARVLGTGKQGCVSLVEQAGSEVLFPIRAKSRKRQPGSVRRNRCGAINARNRVRPEIDAQPDQWMIDGPRPEQHQSADQCSCHHNGNSYDRSQESPSTSLAKSRERRRYSGLRAALGNPLQFLRQVVCALPSVIRVFCKGSLDRRDRGREVSWAEVWRLAADRTT